MRDAVTSGSATRADLAEFKGEITSEFAEFKGEMKSEFAKFKGEITSELAEFKGEIRAEFAAVRSEITSVKVWLMTTTIAVGGVIIATVAFF